METWNDAIDEANEKYAPVKHLLEQYGELLGQDITSYYTYGSPMRPMSATWARIEGAVFMQDGKKTTEYYTIVATPEPLTLDIVVKFELTTL